MTITLATLGRRLKEARTNCGVSQQEAADAIAVPRTAVVQIEAGNRSVSTLELAELARLYKRAIQTFFAEEDAEEEDDVLISLSRVSPDFKDNPEVRREVLRCVAICQEGARMERLLKLPLRCGPRDYHPPVPKNTMDGVRQGEQTAAEERQRLGLGHNPILDMADLISSQGIWASGAGLPPELSGLFLRNSSIGMVVLVNSQHARTRKRFSYAHEYAHALLDRSHDMTVSTTSNRSDLVEVRANAFAAAFLLPGDGVRSFLEMRQKAGPSRQEQFVYDLLTEETGVPTEVKGEKRSIPGSQKVTYQDVVGLAQYFRVSYQAACYRVKSLNAINKQELDGLLEKEEFGRRYVELLKLLEDEPEKRDRKLESQIVALAVEAYRREEISKGKLRDLGRLLDISAKDLIALAEAA